jgi:hypothetical protein
MFRETVEAKAVGGQRASEYGRGKNALGVGGRLIIILFVWDPATAGA